MLNDIYQSLDPVAFSIGSVDVRWYGLAYLAAFVCAALIIPRIVKRWKLNIPLEDILTLVLCVAFGVIIGGRLGYCIFYGEGYYLEHPVQILNLAQGGMSFHGGLIGAILGGVVCSRMTHIPFLTLCDFGAISAPLGIFFGRCANFVNGELWGKETDLPWGVVFANTGGGLVARHPSQLYEAILEGLVMLIILLILARKTDPPRPRGTFLGTFLILYGIFRILIEFVRLPDSQLGYLLGTSWLTMGMCLSIPLIIIGFVMVIVVTRKNLPQGGRPPRRAKADE